MEGIQSTWTRADHLRSIVVSLLVVIPFCATSLPGQDPPARGHVQVEELIDQAEAHYPNQLDDAVIYAHEALHRAKQVDFKKGIADSYFILAKATYKLNDSDRALEYHFMALEYYNDLADRRGVADVFNNVGIIYKNKGKSQLALDYYNMAREIFEDIGDSTGVSKTLINLGVIHRKRGDQKKALDAYLTALTIQEKSGDQDGMATSYVNLGNLYADLDQTELALEAYKESVSLFELMNRKSNTASVLNNMGTLYEEIQMYNMALDHYQRAHAIFLELNSKKGMALTLNNIGSIHGYKYEWKAALQNNLDALEILKEIDQKDLEAEVHLDLGGVLIKLKQFPQAKIHLDMGMAIATQMVDRNKELACLAGLTDYYEATGDFVQALAYFDQYRSLTEDIFNIEKNRELAVIQTKYETEKKEIENTLLLAEISQQRLKNIMLALGSGFLMILALMFYRTSRKKKKANDLLIARQKGIVQSNELLKQSQVRLSKVNRQLTRLKLGLERLVKIKTAELQTSNEELDALLFQSTYNLQGPLQRLLQLTEEGRLQPDSTEISLLNRVIETAALDMDHIVKQVARVNEINQLPHRSRLINFEGLIQRVSQEEDAKIKINCEPGVRCRTDERIMEMVFGHFLSNVQAGRAQGVSSDYDEVEVRIEKVGSDVTIRFNYHKSGLRAVDSGQKTKAYIFSSTTHVNDLGFYLARLALDKVQGTVKVIQEEDQIDTVEIVLPAQLKVEVNSTRVAG